MEGFMSVWMNEEEYEDYIEGKVAIGRNAQGKYNTINLLVPLSHVKEVDMTLNSFTEIVIDGS